MYENLPKGERVTRVIGLILIGLAVPNIVWAGFGVHLDEIVYDSKTTLIWQSNPSSQRFNWNDAQNYCSNLSYAGDSNWRLPNIYELKSLVDYTKYNPAIAISSINIDINDPHYWSSSKDLADSSSALGVDFESGRDLWLRKSGKFLALCVR